MAGKELSTRSLNKRRGAACEIDAVHLCSSGQHADVLAQRPFFNLRTQALRNLHLHQLERHVIAEYPLIDGDDVKAEAGLDETSQNTRRAELKQRRFELRHDVAAGKLTEIAAVLS